MFIHSLAIATRPTLLHQNGKAMAIHRLACLCPNCGGDLLRIRRYPIDRLLSLFVPVRRFRCRDCLWEGLRTKIHRKASAMYVRAIHE